MQIVFTLYQNCTDVKYYFPFISLAIQIKNTVSTKMQNGLSHTYCIKMFGEKYIRKKRLEMNQIFSPRWSSRFLSSLENSVNPDQMASDKAI